MQANCLNCNEPIASNFCGNCGQKKYKRIDKKYIWDEIQYTLLHTNKGFLYSVKQLLKNPGKTAREFIDGNRVNHYKPILLAFVLSGISTFISFKIIDLEEMVSLGNTAMQNDNKWMNSYVNFIKTYNSLISLSLIPFFALITKLAFTKWNHNYFEHIVINSFFFSFYTLIGIIIINPINYIFNNDANTVFIISFIYIITVPFLLLYFFKNFYREKAFKNILINVLLTCIITLLFFSILFILVTIGFVFYIKMFNPELIKLFEQPK